MINSRFEDSGVVDLCQNSVQILRVCRSWIVQNVFLSSLCQGKGWTRYTYTLEGAMLTLLAHSKAWSWELLVVVTNLKEGTVVEYFREDIRKVS